MQDNTQVNLNYKLGDDIDIHRLGYGGMQLTGPGVWGDAPDREGAKNVLREAVAQGVNFIDTADAYGPHTNETLIAEALSDQYDKVIIATKGGLTRTGPGQWPINGDPKHIAEAIEGSLQRLKKDRIDLWQLHRIDPKFPVEETLAPVVEAVKAGKIRHVGLSEVGIEEIEQVRKLLPVVSVQNHYNLSERKWGPVVDYTEKENIAFIPWYPLASGPGKLGPKLEEMAAKYKATPAQVALAWLLRRASNILLIPGTKSPEHLKENIGAVSVQLSDADYQELTGE